MDVSHYQPRLSVEDISLLERIQRALPILADLSRSDLLLYVFSNTQEALIWEQARPRSIFPIYEEDLVGRRVTARFVPWVFHAVSGANWGHGIQHGTVRDAPIVRDVLPVLGAQRQPIAALSIETNLLAHERHRRRSPAFRRALRQLQEMVLRGELLGVESLSPFGEHDGILVVDIQRRIQYASGIASNLFRRIGYQTNLVRHSIYRIETADAELMEEAVRSGACLERETPEHGRIWIRKALPISVRSGWARLLQSLRGGQPSLSSAIVAVLLTVHDETEARDREQELKAKMAMIEEVHHRVKNNLQAIASLLRLQLRRSSSGEVQLALQESVNRILSVAVVHEFLSYNSTGVINLRDVAQRITDQMAQSVVDPAKEIRFNLEGPGIYLTAQQATACALVINELLQNAIEHGFEYRNSGEIRVALTDDGQHAIIEIGDDGSGLPSDFSLDGQGGLGLRIVQTLVHNDLKGRFELRGEQGVSAIVTFPKTSLGGT